MCIGGAGGQAPDAADRRGDGLERGGDDVGVHAHPPQHLGVLAVADLALHVRGGQRVAAGGERVLARSRAPGPGSRAAEIASTKADTGPLPSPVIVRVRPRSTTCRADLVRPSGAGRALDTSTSASGASGVRYSARRLSQSGIGADLAAVGVGVGLDHPGELDLQPARQVQVVLGLHDVRHAALAGLRVDPDHGLVGAADVVRVDRQVRRLPVDLAPRRCPARRPACPGPPGPS